MDRPAPPMTKIVIGLAAVAIGAQIVYPLVSGSARDVVTVAVVAFLAAAALAHASASRGPKWTAMMFLTTAGLGLLAEMIGTATGIPFGSYFYATGRLGPDIVGVPAVVPLAWTAGFYPIWCAVTYVLRRSATSTVTMSMGRIVLTAAGMVGWDLYLDTQMVTDGHWTWTSSIAGLPGIGFIPVSNYAGWFAVALAMAAVVETMTRLMNSTHDPDVSAAPPLVLFLWTWLGSALAHAALLDGDELRYSAVYGFVAMGIVGVLLTKVLLEHFGRARATPTGPRPAP